MYRCPPRRRPNPNRGAKILHPWFSQQCRGAKRHWEAARRSHGRTSALVRQRHGHYIATLRRARRDFILRLEGLRLASPQAFWNLLKPPRPLL